MSQSTAAAPYSPPAELLKKASKELKEAPPGEVEGAGRAYEAYNHAVGGRSAATGAQLPSWEQNPNNLVRYGWLEVHRQQQAEGLREVDAMAKEFREERREGMLRLLEEPRLQAQLSSASLTMLKRLAGVDVVEAHAVLVKILAGELEKARKELSMLRLSVAAAFNAMEAETPLNSNQLKLLEVSAKLLEGMGQPEVADFLRACMRGEGSVDVDELTRHGLPVEMKAEVPGVTMEVKLPTASAEPSKA